MYQRITNWPQLHPPYPVKHQWARYGARGHHANWFGARITSVRWLWKFCVSHGRVFPLFFANSTSNKDAKKSAKDIINNITRHAVLPTTLISDKGSAFALDVNKEVAVVLGITLKHATTKHAQTIGLLKQCQTSIKQALKIEKGERRSLWHKYISIAVLN